MKSIYENLGGTYKIYEYYRLPLLNHHKNNRLKLIYENTDTARIRKKKTNNQKSYFRENILISANKYTDKVSDILFKILQIKKKKAKIIYT